MKFEIFDKIFEKKFKLQITVKFKFLKSVKNYFLLDIHDHNKLYMLDYLGTNMHKH